MFPRSTCELFRRCLNERDGRAWQEFVRRFGRAVRILVFQALRRQGWKAHRDEIDELVQDFYFRLLRIEAPDFDGRSDGCFWTYLVRVAETLARDHQRRFMAQMRRSDWGLEARRGQLPRWVRTRVEELTPEEVAIRRQVVREFWRQCRRATRRRADLWIFHLALVEGRTSREIVRLVDAGLSPSQIDGLIHRLKRRLALRGITVPDRRGRRTLAGLATGV